jgi:hypothetical protein
LYGDEKWSLTLREKRRLRVSENRVLIRIFGLKRNEVAWDKENYIRRSLMICTPRQILFG